jgi:ABC-type transporter MlaC component
MSDETAATTQETVPEGPPDDGDDQDYLAPPAARSRRPLIVLAAGLLVVATFLGVLAAGYNDQLQDERSEREEVQEVAARVATALLTYDYRDLEASKRRVLGDATGTFRKEYEKAFDTSLKVLITETKAQSKGTVTDLFMSEVDDGTASVLAVVNAERQGAGGRVPVAASYIQLDLVNVRGSWKVDNVTNLNFAQAAGGSPRPTGAPGPTTTSIP